ncbi:MAG: flagellar hook-length control protein FliK [Pseudomonadota bacterium]
MSVAPDLLLRPAPELKPKAAPVPAKQAEPRNDKADSFAQVYAKERQAKPVDRGEAPRASAAEALPDEQSEEVPIDATAAEQPSLADSGKPLPTEPDLDPLLLMGMTGQMPIDVQATVLPLGSMGEGEEGGEGSSDLSGFLALLPGNATVAPAASEMTAEDQAAAKAQAQAQAFSLADLQPSSKTPLALATQQATPTAQATQSSQDAGQLFASALGNLDEQALKALAVEESVDVAAGFSPEGLDSLKDSVADNRGDSNRLAALSQAATQQPSPAQRAALIPGLPVPMQQGAWSEAVVDRVMWLSSQNLKSAEIQLDPAELGRLEVRISLNQDQTQVTFASPNAQVREALEGQMHRLRELFSQQGMNQPDVNVSDQSLNRGWQGQGQEGDGRQQRAGREEEGAGSSEERLIQGITEVRVAGSGGGPGLVDYYA